MRILIWLVVGYLVYRMVRAKVAPEIDKDKDKDKETITTETFRDPVCGVYVSEADAVVGKMEGKRYHFCSIGCLRQFEQIQQQR